MFRGSGPEPGPLLPEPLGPGPEPRASRYGSCTVRSCSRTLGGGSYDSRVLCRESLAVRFPGREGGGSGLSEPCCDLALRGREGQSVQEVASGQRPLDSLDLADSDPVQVRELREDLHRVLEVLVRHSDLRAGDLEGALVRRVRVPSVDSRGLLAVAGRCLRRHASGLPSAHRGEEVEAELRGSLERALDGPRRAQRGGGSAAQDQGGEGGHGLGRGLHGKAPGTRCHWWVIVPHSRDTPMGARSGPGVYP